MRHKSVDGGGIIRNYPGLAVFQPMRGFGLSVATWAGLIGFAKTMSLELAPDRITINTICPGFINTTRLDKVFRQQAEAEGRPVDEFIADLARSIPLRRLGTPDDIAAMVALLVSPRRSLCTGTT